MDAVGPLSSLLEQTQAGQLTIEAAANAAQLVLQFLGNAHANTGPVEAIGSWSGQEFQDACALGNRAAPPTFAQFCTATLLRSLPKFFVHYRATD